MTEIQVLSPVIPGNRMLRFTAFLFGGVAYLTFLFTILYAIGFVSGLAVPKTIDTGATSGIFEAIAINLAVMALFDIQLASLRVNHSNTGGRSLFQGLSSAAPMCYAQA
jgi:methanethiol S-methyltransferase